MGWEEQDPNVVASRYDRIASIYGLFAWFRLVPFGSIRKRAIEALALSAGDSVLEIGCGSGQNFAGLVGRIGSSGSLLGVDISQRMLIRAQKLCHRRGWRNVSLTRSGATAYGYENRVRAVLFSFSRRGGVLLPFRGSALLVALPEGVVGERATNAPPPNTPAN